MRKIPTGLIRESEILIMRNALLVKIHGKEASLLYDTDTWKLTLRYLDSATPEFEISISEIKKIYVSSKYQETHYEEKNKLARTIIGGALGGVTGAIIGAVSGEGSKSVVDGTYSYIYIETENQEFVVVCKENVLNSSWAFITNINELISAGSYEAYKKNRRKFATKWLTIIAIGILINVALWLLISLLE
jgi:hypothetical protein